MRCRCAPSRRRPAEASCSLTAHACPHSTGESLVYPRGRARPLEPKRARSPKSTLSAANFPGSPSPHCSLRQPWERCAPSRAARPLPTRHPWDRLPSAAPLGARSLRRVARETSETPRRSTDSTRVSLLGSPAGQRSYPGVSSPFVAANLSPQLVACREGRETPES